MIGEKITRWQPPASRFAEPSAPPPNPGFAERWARLSRRERQLVRLQCEGRSLVEITKRIDRAEQTSKNHVYNARRRLGFTGFGAPHRVCYELGRMDERGE